MESNAAQQRQYGVKISPKMVIGMFALFFVLLIGVGILTKVLPQGAYERTVVDGQETIVNGTYKLLENPTVLPVWKWFTAPVEVLFSSDGPLVVFVIFLSVMVGGIYYVLDKADVLKRMIAWIYRKFGKQKYFILFFMTSLFLIVGSTIGFGETIIGIIPGTGASMASWFSYDRARSMSKHPEEFGKGSVEGIAAAESANNAVTGATLIPLLTLGIPGDGCVAIMLSALMINGLNPGLSLFTEQGDIMYAIMLGLILVNAFMFVQGRFLTNLFAKVVSVPQEILTPIIVMFCFAGAFSVNKSYFDVLVALVFCAVAWLLRKIDFPAVPILLGLVLGKMAETNFRRALMVSRGSYSIFVSSPFCIAFLALTALVIGSVAFNKMKARKKKNG